MTDWEKIGQTCVREALNALRVIKTAKTFDDNINPHTDADMVAHDAIIDVLKKSGAACEVISEESTEKIILNGGGSVKVMVDPLDNTVFFLRGEFSFCSVGLFVIDNGVPIYSFVGNVSNGDIYYCDETRAYKNGNPIKMPESLPGKLILNGWAPYVPRMEKFWKNFSKLPLKEYYVFNFGSMLENVQMTDGYYDACFHVTPTKLGEFAGAIIAWRAGGEITTMEGPPIVWDPDIKQTMLVSKDKMLHQKLLTAFNS
jgi:fructose-1,6-bisphosphatase/inositol monophosphatase family enzyme